MWALWVVVGGGLLSITRGEEDAYGENRTLTIMVPRKVGFQQFANAECSGDNNSTCSFSGFAVEVFNACIRNLAPRRPLHINYTAFGDGLADPSYDAMVHSLKNKEAHGIVADLTIIAERMKLVDFTHPYIQSTLVMVVPYLDNRASKKLWSFMQPFSLGLWISILVLFTSTGLVIFALEQKNPHFHQEHMDWRHRLANVFWFTSMTLFIAQNADISTKLGRLLTFFWLMGVVIFTSTYTATLASILSSMRHVPKYATFREAQRNTNITIGCNDGSFTKEYIENNLNIDKHRLRVLATPKDYEKSFQNQSVDVILDELPYIQTFLHTRCQYTKIHQQVAYFGGFGFAFQKDSSLTLDISMEILRLEQNGVLQRLRDRLLGVDKCSTTEIAGTNIPLSYFGGLFIIVLTLYTICIFLRLLLWWLNLGNQPQNKITTTIEVSSPTTQATKLPSPHAPIIELATRDTPTPPVISAPTPM